MDQTSNKSSCTGSVCPHNPVSEVKVISGTEIAPETFPVASPCLPSPTWAPSGDLKEGAGLGLTGGLLKRSTLSYCMSSTQARWAFVSPGGPNLDTSRDPLGDLL